MANKKKATKRKKHGKGDAVVNALKILGASIDKGETKAIKRAFKAFSKIAVPYIETAAIWGRYIELSNIAAQKVTNDIMKEFEKAVKA